ncbi:MAG: hypothetical protein QNL04_04245 [SAR324 cluster bacterium]|nr:hypothetical protein [SAR324 cluster bacterium]
MKNLFLLLFLLLILNWAATGFAQISPAETQSSVTKQKLANNPVALYNRAIDLETKGKKSQALYYYRLSSPDLKVAQEAQARMIKELGLPRERHIPLVKIELFAVSFGLCLLGAFVLLAHKKKPNQLLKNWGKGSLALGIMLSLPLLPFNMNHRVQVMDSTPSFSGPGSSFYQLGEFRPGEMVTVKLNLADWLQVEQGGQVLWLPQGATKKL